MAQLFYEVISTEYAGGGENLPKTYRHISFAIFDDHNSNKKHNPEGNLLPFQDRFANGLDNRPINNVAGKMDSISNVSQEDDESSERQRNFQRNWQSISGGDGQSSSFFNRKNNEKNDNDYQGDQNQNRRPYNERRGGNSGRGRGRGFEQKELSQSQSSTSRQMTLDDAWRHKQSQNHVDELTRMGYSERMAKRALHRTKGNVKDAVDWLKQNVVSDEMVNLGLNKQVNN